MQPVLEVQNLHLSIHNRQLVRAISFTIQPGETVALVGASGCGKSLTAQSIVLPVAKVDEGAIFFQGEDLLKKSAREMQSIRGKKIGLIFQDPSASLNPTMRIGDQIVESIRAHLKVTRQEAEERALQLLARVGIAEPATRMRQYPFELSGGMLQRVMIAMAISCDPPLLIADEPTTALDLTIQAQILALLKSIQKEQKLALLFITHDLGVVAGITDKVLVMHQGAILEQGSTDQIFYNPRHPITKQLFAPYRLDSTTGSGIKKIKKSEIALLFDNVSHSYRVGTKKLLAVSSLTLSIRQGETLGLVGESGSGKSTIGKLGGGLIKPTAGKIFYQDQPVELTKKFCRSVQTLFQNPYGSLNPQISVEKILLEPFTIHRDLTKKDPRTLLEEVGLSSDYLKRYPQQLSGGQRQRIALARALAVDPEFIILDEPLSALDALSQHQILELLQRLKIEKNISYLFISHDLKAVQKISDRIGVIYLGQLVELGETESLRKNPSHPYTQALFSAICYPDPKKERRRKPLLLKGELSNLFDVASGCSFQTRCPYAKPLCQTASPPFVEIEKGHFSRCHFANAKVSGIESVSSSGPKN